MGKSLSDRIALKAREAAIPQPGARHLATVLDMKEEIKKALDDGWAKKTIWKQLFEEKAFDGSYSTFLRAWSRVAIERPAKPKDVPKLENRQQSSGPRIVSDPEDKPFSFDNIKRK